MDRLGRSKPWHIGPGVTVAVVLDDKASAWFFPQDQTKFQMHRRHPAGWNTQTGERGCFSPSCSFYSDLCKYAEFRWQPKTAEELAPKPPRSSHPTLSCE